MKEETDELFSKNLVPCEDCGNLISKRAESCPKCGCPRESKSTGQVNFNQNQNNSKTISKIETSESEKSKTLKHIQALSGILIIVGAGFMIFKSFIYDPRVQATKLAENKKQMEENPLQYFLKNKSCNDYCKLEKIDFSNRDLQGVNLENARLGGSSFENSNLNNANFRNADLDKVNFQNAKLMGADFTGASLSGANFRNANLSRAKFYGSFMYNADLRNSNLDGAGINNTTDIVDANFLGAKGLRIGGAGGEEMANCGAIYPDGSVKHPRIGDECMTGSSYSPFFRY